MLVKSFSFLNCLTLVVLYQRYQRYIATIYVWRYILRKYRTSNVKKKSITKVYSIQGYE